MERENICGEKFVFGHETISLPLSIKNIPNELTFQGDTFLINDFLHVSLVCIGKIKEKYKILLSDFESKIIDDFCKFTENQEIGLTKYNNDFKLVEQQDKKTIIVMCEVSNLLKFFELINKKYGLDVEYPPTHVTLYKLPGKRGIFLTDSNDLKNLTKSIQNPIGGSLEL